jgi:Tol biopolymer transport system component
MYVANTGGVSNIWLQPLDGSTPSQITNFDEEQILALEWSADGRMLCCIRSTIASDVVLLSE